MKKQFILLIISYLALQSCHNEQIYKDKYTLKSAEDSIRIKIGNDSRNFSLCIQFLTSKDSTYLAVMSDDHKSIDIYNLETNQLFKRIETSNEGRNAFPGTIGFIMKNIDTMLAISTSPRSIGFINLNGEIIKKIPWQDENIGRFTEPAVPTVAYRPILDDNTLFLSTSTSALESNGILTPSKMKLSNLHINIDLISGKCTLFPCTYPEILIGKNIQGLHISRAFGNNNCFVYTFNIIDGLFISRGNKPFEHIPLQTNYNLKLKPIEQKKNNSIIDVMKYYSKYDEIIDIRFDEYRNCYYVIIRKRKEALIKSLDLRSEFLYPDCLITILDENFNFLGDVFLPDDTYSFQMTFVSPEGLYISEDNISNPNFDEDFIQFRLFTLEKL